jgi:RNA polymerase sigma-70 factor, ECF subfamily
MIDVMHENDAGDVHAALAGSDEALARLYDRHSPIVLSLCRRSSLAEAEDAMQETFIRAFRKLHTLENPATFRAWLYAIAARVCSEHRRAAGRRTKHEAQARMRNTMIAMNHEHDAIERMEDLVRLSEALDQLPEQERLAIHLHYLESDPVTAAMPALGVSRSGFYKLLARARKRLASLLGEGAPRPCAVQKEVV